MKVIVEYDQVTGEIKDKSGMTIGSWFELEHFGSPDEPNKVRDIIKLKDAGFTAEDIVTMKEGGLL